MGKPFFEVFPSLKLDSAAHDIMEQAEVERVSTTKKKDYIRIYLHSSRLIMKDIIWTVEKQIKSQLFPQASLTIKIYEKFELSSQYTPEKLLDVYKDCILEEVRAYSNIAYNALKGGVFSFPEENKVILEMEDTVIARSKEEELLDILQKVLVERCGFSVGIYAQYREAKVGKFAEDDELRIKREVAEIYKRVRRAAGEDAFAETAGGDEKSQKAESKEQSQKSLEKASAKPASAPKEFKKDFKKGEFNKGGSFGGSAKRSDNPDVIYGRDFEDEAMKIEDIVGEIGEVTIRGKVLGVEVRELRNGEKSIISFNVTDFTDTITVKMFARNEQVPEITGGIKKGAFVKIKGISMIDKFDRELSIQSVA